VVLDFYEEPRVFGFNNKIKTVPDLVPVSHKMGTWNPVLGLVPNKKRR